MRLRPPGWVYTGMALAVLWLFVRGIAWIDHPITLLEESIIGLVIGLPVAYVTRRMYDDGSPFAHPVLSPVYAVVYVAVFLWEMVVANVDVATRVLSPSLPIHPNVIEVPLRVETDLAITTIANSITLTPGTLTMDHDDERNALYVHAIDARKPDEVLAPIRRWESYALVIFDERRSPGDPVPDPEAVADSDADSDSDSNRNARARSDADTSVFPGADPTSDPEPEPDPDPTSDPDAEHGVDTPHGGDRDGG